MVKAVKSCIGEFSPLEGMYTGLTTSTANVAYIQEVVAEKWGAGYNLVSSDCLKIVDSPATRGKL